MAHLNQERARTARTQRAQYLTTHHVRTRTLAFNTAA